MHILLIEDHQDLAANICEYLQGCGHVMDTASDGITGLHLAVVNDYDAIILDGTLPGMDGLLLCQKLRKEARKNIPVLMLTARDTLNDKLKGFEAGTDDYLVKPFSLEELEARLRALTRRTQYSITNQLQVADLVLDLDTLQARRAGQLLVLTPIGIKLLALLMRESPRVVMRRQVERALWGDNPPDSDALRAHIYALRSVMDRPFATKLLYTVHGTGYRLVDPDAPAP
jgi:DNA-binding response OmpR family regulator